MGCELAKCDKMNGGGIIIGAVRAFIDFRDVRRSAPKMGASRARPVFWRAQLTDGFSRAQLTGETAREWGLPNIMRSLKQMAPNLGVLMDLPGGREVLEAEDQGGGRWRRNEKHFRLLRQYGIVPNSTPNLPTLTLQEYDGPNTAEESLAQ